MGNYRNCFGRLIILCLIEGWFDKNLLISRQKRKGHHRFTFLGCGGNQASLEGVRDGHFAGGDFGFVSADEAKVAAAECVTGSGWRAEDAAGHGTPGVDAAEAGSRVEGRTSGLISEIVEAGLVGI